MTLYIIGFLLCAISLGIVKTLYTLDSDYDYCIGTTIYTKTKIRIPLIIWILSIIICFIPNGVNFAFGITAIITLILSLIIEHEWLQSSFIEENKFMQKLFKKY